MTSNSAYSGGKPGQRALWSFLLVTLVAPFLTALVVFLSGVIAGLVGRGPASLLALDRAGQLAWSAEHALGAYVWSAWPAALAGAVVAALVMAARPLPWLVGAVLGAVSATLFAVFSGGMISEHAGPIAFIGAFVGVAMRAILARARLVL